jgi:hypothetical protein
MIKIEKILERIEQEHKVYLAQKDHRTGRFNWPTMPTRNTRPYWCN